MIHKFSQALHDITFSALIYFTLGCLGIAISSATNFIEVISLSTGFALAILLRLPFKRGLPAITIGAVAVCLYRVFAFKQAIDLQFLLMPFIAVLQAYIGMKLFRCWVSTENTLSHDRELLRFSLIAPIIALVNIVLTILVTQWPVASEQNLSVIEWLMQWVIDTLALLLVVPVVLSFFEYESKLWNARRWALTINCFVLLFLTFQISSNIKAFENNRLLDRFKIITNQTATLFQVAIKEKVLLQSSIAQMFASSEYVSRQEFQSFVRGLTTSNHFIQVIEWLPKVTDAERDRYEAEQRQYFGQNFSILGIAGKGQLSSAQRKAIYFPITYLEPEQGNETAFGFDPSSVKGAAALIYQAIELGKAQVREPIEIFRGTDFTRTLIVYKPVFKRADGTVTTNAAHADIYGFINVVIKVNDFISTILASTETKNFHIQWQDVETGQYYYQPKGNLTSPFTQVINFQLSGRDMRLIFTPTEAFLDSDVTSLSSVTTISGFVIACFLSVLILIITARTTRIQNEVQSRTEALSKATDNARESESRMRLILTEMQAAEAKLKLSDVAFNSASEAIIISDGKMRVIAVNSAFCEITGYSESSILNQAVFNLMASHQTPQSEEDKARIKQAWTTLEKEGVWRGEVIALKSDGSQFPASVSISAVYDDENRLINLVGVFSDITESKQAQETIEKQANYDVLTNLPNRRLFNDRLEQAINRSTRDNQRVCLMFLDLDRFKDINDTLGHEFGDELLCRVATRIRNAMRQVDTVARLGGDEFTVIVDQIEDKFSIELLAEKLIDAIKQPLVIFGRTISVTTSLGITFYPDDAVDIKGLLQNADRAMYDAKEYGGNGFKVYNPELEASWNARHFIINELEAAIERSELVIYYQPINAAHAADKWVSAEALVRWQHPKKGLIPPDEFLPIAERMGMMSKIDDYVFEAVCKQLKEWKQAGYPDIRISINQSPHNFGLFQGRLDWLACIEQYEVKPEQITLEITESTLMQRSMESRQFIQKLREFGIKIAVDDFGTGYSSLAYLKALDVDYLKIDSSFVHDIEIDENDRAIILAIISMAKNLDIETVAEGVETKNQADILQNMACSWIQGYYYSRPLPESEFTLRILNNSKA